MVVFLLWIFIMNKVVHNVQCFPTEMQNDIYKVVGYTAECTLRITLE